MWPQRPAWVLAIVLLLTSGAAFAEHGIDRQVVAQGAGTATGGTYQVIATIGQATIGAIADSSQTMQLGFWYASFGVPDAVEESETGIPIHFSLGSAFPNPGRWLMTLRLAIPRRSYVEVALYDVRGRAVRRLHTGELDPGYHTVVLEAADLSCGIYFCRMVADHFRQTQRLVLIR